MGTVDKESKIAIATNDGIDVAEHFGSAPLFYVATVRRGRVIAEETRPNRYHCAESERAGLCWDLISELLPDVRAVITTGMGENAYVGLLRRDILPLVTTETNLHAALRAYLSGKLKEEPRRVHPSRLEKDHE